MEGFIWLPTQKLKWQGNEAEIDVIACADRRLVLAECKDLENAGPSSPSWTDVWGQFEQLVEIAVACHADLVVLGVLAEQFPDDWQTRAKTLAGTRVRVLLLNRTDLQKLVGDYALSRPVFRLARTSSESFAFTFGICLQNP